MYVCMIIFAVEFFQFGKINRINWRCTNEKIAIFYSNNDLWTVLDHISVFIRAICVRCLFQNHFETPEIDRQREKTIPEFYVRNEIPLDFFSLLRLFSEHKQ